MGFEASWRASWEFRSLHDSHDTYCGKILVGGAWVGQMTSIRIRYQCHQCKNRVSCSFSLGDRTCCIGVMKSPAKPHQIMTKTVPLLVMFLISKGCSAWNFQGARCDALIFRWAFCSPETAFRASPTGQISQSQGLVPNLFHHTHFLGSEEKNELEGGKMVHFLMWEMRNSYADWMCI